jgi:hypothetical protein
VSFLRRWPFALAALFSACSIYNDELLNSANGDGDGDGDGDNVKVGGSDNSGGKDTGGGSSGGGSSGGSSGSGSSNAGGSDPGGTGGDADGGMGGDMVGDGGTDSGGSDSGGSDGGGSGGGIGTGGNPPAMVDTLIEDMNHLNMSSYTNDDFFGIWDRYGQSSTDPSCNDADWTSVTVGGMFVDRTDDPGNSTLRVLATALDCWGVGTYFTLRQPSGGTPAQPVDLSMINGISFWARADGAEKSLRIGLEDEYSHAETCSTGCDTHAVVQGVALTSNWKQYDIPLVAFSRTPALDDEKVYAIHFQMDPSSTRTSVDFMVDDVYTY